MEKFVVVSAPEVEAMQLRWDTIQEVFAFLRKHGYRSFYIFRTDHHQYDDEEADKLCITKSNSYSTNYVSQNIQPETLEFYSWIVNDPKQKRLVFMSDKVFDEVYAKVKED